MTKPIPTHIIKGPPPTIHIHRNGPNRKRKVMVRTSQGTFSARRYYYKLFHPDWDGKGKVIHLNNNDLDFSPNNLVLLSTRECNNLVHFNNPYLNLNDKALQKLAIKACKLRIATHDLERRLNDEA
jgi:hypothetical protein